MAHLVVPREGAAVGPGVEHLLLGARDDVEDVALVVPVHAPRAEHGAALAGAPHVDALGQAGEMRLPLQAAQREAVKRVDAQLGRVVEREVARDADAHLLGGLLGEGQRHDAVGVGAGVAQVAEAPDQRRRLARSGARQHELDRMVGAGGAALGRVEFGHPRCHATGGRIGECGRCGASPRRGRSGRERPISARTLKQACVGSTTQACSVPMPKAAGGRGRARAALLRIP